jgi:nucleoside-diphosphate-sugar epimerase
MLSYWAGKQTVVTGGAGFVGSHLVERLLSSGSDVTIIDNFERGHNLDDRAHCLDLDIDRDPAAFELSLRELRPDVIFNLAASVAGVLYNQTHNAEMFARNIALQTIPVMIAAHLQIPHFVQVSSVCVYAPEYAANANEKHGQLGEPVAANNGYAWAKRMGERAVLWSDLPHAVIVRPSNMYGPRDYFDERAHVIPALIKKCLEDDVIKVHGTGHEVREFLYAEDAAQMLLKAVEFGRNRSVYNLGTNGKTKTSIADLLLKIQAITQTIDKPIEFTGGQAGDQLRWSDCSKAISEFGLTQFTSLTYGLERTIDWCTTDAKELRHD